MARLSFRPATLRKKSANYSKGSAIINADEAIKGLGGFLKTLSEMEKKGETEKEGTGEIDLPGGKAMYGYSVKIGGAGVPHIEHVGNIRRDTGSGPVVDEIREPIVDIHEENDQIELIAELPGVHEKDISYEIKEDSLILNASSDGRKYNKEIILPSKASVIRSSYKNGIYRLVMKKETEGK